MLRAGDGFPSARERRIGERERRRGRGASSSSFPRRRESIPGCCGRFGLGKVARHRHPEPSTLDVGTDEEQYPLQKLRLPCGSLAPCRRSGQGVYVQRIPGIGVYVNLNCDRGPCNSSGQILVGAIPCAYDGKRGNHKGLPLRIAYRLGVRQGSRPYGLRTG